MKPQIAKRLEQIDFRRRSVQVGSASMHEVSIMTEALRMAVDAAKSAGASRVLKLRLRIGCLSGVVPEAMRFAFDVVCHDTMAEGASLEIEPVPAACWCATCRTEFEGADFYNECPRCHNVSGELRRGRELEIASVEMD
jgi:hydrogenase nickel incorporation protein HypA/HybF